MKNQRKQRRTRAFWLELVRRYEDTPNVTQKQFALQNDVTIASLQHWLYTFRKLDASPLNHQHNEPVRFIEIPHTAPPIQNQTQVAIFFPNDLILEFSALPQPEYLAALMASLREH